MTKKTFFAMALLLALFGVRASAQSSTTASSSTLRVWIDDVTLTADGETVGYLRINENDVIDYCAFQMRINVPEGLTLKKVKVGRNTYDALPTDRFTSSHSASCNMVDAGSSIKIGVISSSNELFFPDDEDGNALDELCAIAVTADPEMVNGVYEITMDDIKFILPTSFAYYPETTTAAKLTIVGGQDVPVGVNNNAAGLQKSVYHDLSGRVVQNPTRGIYVKDNKKVMNAK